VVFKEKKKIRTMPNFQARTGKGSGFGGVCFDPSDPTAFDVWHYRVWSLAFYVWHGDSSKPGGGKVRSVHR
jgi:hypothetical protein